MVNIILIEILLVKKPAHQIDQTKKKRFSNGPYQNKGSS